MARKKPTATDLTEQSVALAEFAAQPLISTSESDKWWRAILGCYLVNRPVKRSLALRGRNRTRNSRTDGAPKRARSHGVACDSRDSLFLRVASFKPIVDSGTADFFDHTRRFPRRSIARP